MQESDPPSLEESAVEGPLHTTPFLTKYECARLLSLRVLQLQSMDHPLQDEDPSLMRQAAKEILDGKNPCVIRRRLPGGRVEDCPVRKLRVSNELKKYQLNLERGFPI